MKTKESFSKRSIKWFITFAILSACVDRISFNVPATQILTVVEGMISDSPGPYTVKVSKSISLNADSLYNQPIEKAKVKLFDDEGNAEDFTEASPGTYITGGVIQGKMGHSYYIVIETLEGTIFKSQPDKINPVGEIEQIYYTFAAGTTQTNTVEVENDVFNISVDANGGPGENNYVRWRFTGTYKVVTHPELHVTVYPTPPPNIVLSPYPCSGWVVDPALGGGKLAQVGECTCCTCWVNQFESEPTLSDGQLVNNNEYKNVKVGVVPINGVTFTEKYMVEVDQMSLSENSFNFFKLIRAQKDGASSLFQPPYGEIRGNLSAQNSTDPVVGLFWATSITSKYVFIQKSDVPYAIYPVGIAEPCTTYSNSSLSQPPFWQ